MVPGEITTLEEAQRKLDEAPFVASTYTRSDGDGYLYWTSALSDLNGYAGEISINADGRIAYIFLRWLEYELTVQELLDSAGEPDWVHVIVIDAFEGIGPAAPTCYKTELIWLEQGIRIALRQTSESEVSQSGQLVSPDTRVVSVFYFSPVVSLNAYLMQIGLSAENSRYYQEWVNLETIVAK